MRKNLFVVAVAAMGALASCDLLSQLQASKAMVGTVLATPAVNVEPAALGGDGGVLTLPAQTAAFVFFGNRESEQLTAPPVPISDAQVTLGRAGQAAAPLKNTGNGTYSKSSVEDASFQYQAATTYEFTATSGGENFVGKVENSPAPETIAAFHPAKGFIDQTANTAFTFTRPEPGAGAQRTLGFVTIVPIGTDGQRGTPTYTNTPSTPVQFLQLIANPSEWKTASVTVPATAFPEPGKTYVLLFQSVASGGASSKNLFAGSAFLAGTADVAVFRTK